MNQGRLTARDGCFAVDGRTAFLLGDTAWSALTDATDDEWQFYLAHRSRQGFNAVFASVLPILHDRSRRPAAGPAPFDEDLVRRDGRWELNPQFFDQLRRRLDQAAGAGMVCGLVLLWVNYVADTWAAQRTPGFVLPAAAQQRYLAALARVLADGEALLIISGDAAFTSPAEVAAYAQFSEHVRRTWPGSLITYHSTPQATLPPELERMSDALIFQSGHYGDQPLTRELARRYRAMAGGRPVLNAEPAYEGHRISGGVGRFGRAEVRRRIWESVAAGASAGVTYGAHGLWGWHRDGDDFTSVPFSGAPLDWREALLLPGADDAAACRRIAEAEQLLRLAVPPASQLAVADEAWGADQVEVGADLEAGVAAVYLPHGGPVTLRRAGPLLLRRAVDLQRDRDVAAGCHRSGADLWIIDPPGSAAEVLLVLDLG